VAQAGAARVDREVVADQQRLVKTGGRLIQHARYYWLLLNGRLSYRLRIGVKSVTITKNFMGQPLHYLGKWHFIGKAPPRNNLPDPNGLSVGAQATATNALSRTRPISPRSGKGSATPMSLITRLYDRRKTLPRRALRTGFRH
jgi:hypothetical protein